jgi:PAS domain S-box-containing protein
MPEPAQLREKAAEEARTVRTDLAHGLAQAPLPEDVLLALTQSWPLAAAVLDERGCARLWNPAAERLLGWQVGEALGNSFPGITDAGQEAFEGLLRRVRQDLAGCVLEMPANRKDGTILDLRLWAAPLLGTRPDSSSVLLLMADITRYKSLEAENRHLQKVEAISRLTGGIVHDFNNMLTVILGGSGILLAGLPPQDPLRDALGDIRKAADRAARLTRQLLAVSRKNPARLHVLDVNASIREMRTLLERLLGEDIRIEMQLDPDLRPVQADEGQLGQVLLNLVVNARDAMPTGGILSIATSQIAPLGGVGGAPVGPFSVLVVRDTGCGMSDEVKARLFEPFFTTKQPDRGTGLGLATVQGLVREMGGHIAVESESGRGSTFRVFLPSVEGTPATPQVAPASGHLRGGRETVLLVEDEGFVRELFRAILAGHGYTVLEAADGATALRVSDSYAGPIHLLVSDVVLPGLSGPEVAQRLWQCRPHLRTLFVSGYGSEEVLRRVPGGAPLLTKPFPPDDLAARVREILDNVPAAG